MFGVGLAEFGVILVIAVLVFGPDRLPEFGRQAGRIVRRVRDLARAAQTELREELGPDYADLKLTDLDPRRAIRKHIMEALEEDEEPPVPSRPLLAEGELPPYDPEAT